MMTPTCFFVSDLHGRIDRYRKLFQAVAAERPAAVFFGGDLLAHSLRRGGEDDLTDFFSGFLANECSALQAALGTGYPRLFMILGNDDGRLPERSLIEAGSNGLWQYVHGRGVPWHGLTIYGYSYVPPTPFLLKDWERYDVSRYVDPGCVSPEEGYRTVAVAADQIRDQTIRADLGRLLGDSDPERSLWLFHTPPYQTNLDRADLDEQTIDCAPLDVHVGSMAVRRFIEDHQPLLTLHGHVHESARLTGSWRDRIGETHAFSAAHDGPELALVRFDPDRLEAATRALH